MSLKEKWVDKVDGVDVNSADDINQVANAVIELEENAVMTEELNEKINEALQEAKEGGEFNGEDGKSAYAYAQDGGYTGTEAEFAKKLAKGYPNTSVTEYGAKGDGTTDDTVAFQNALAANRTVFVPGGTYKLTSGITIGDNCCLELAQDAVLNFTNTSGNCITLGMLSNLVGNHATVNVPYEFSGNVLYAYSNDTTSEEATQVPPWTKWCPMWKSGRYVTDINICKANASGNHASVGGECSGTAVYLSANGSSGSLTYMWGIHFSGLRIAGAFSYGIRAVNTNEGWMHEMRVDAFIDACEIGVQLEDCNNAYVSAVVQPRTTWNDDPSKRVKYAKHGIKLVRSTNADLSGSRVWDWDAEKTLWTDGGEYQSYAMIGDCRGAILNDFRYHGSGDTRKRIYTDTASNLEKLTIVQEPVDRWFKVNDGVPYYNDGGNEKKLLTQDEFDDCFVVDRTPLFTDALANAIDKSGAIYNGTGYKSGIYVVPSTGADASDPYYWSTGYIACKAGDVIRAQNLSFANAFANGDGVAKVVYFDKNFNRFWSATAQVLNGGSNYYQKATTTDDSFELTIMPTLAEQGIVAYIRITLGLPDVYERPVISVNEAIEFTYNGYLADGIKVKGENVIGGGNTSGGTSIDVTAEVGQTIIVKEVDANGKPTKWESAEYQPRTHWKTETVILPETVVECSELDDDEDGVGDGFFLGMLPEFMMFTPGNEYKVTYNGVDYLCKTIHQKNDSDEIWILGNSSLVEFDGGVVDAPFVLLMQRIDTGEGIEQRGAIANIDGSTTITLSIAEIVCHTIPSEYLPKQQYIFEVPMESFRYDDAGKDYRLILSEIPLALLEAMYLQMPIYLKVIEIYNGEINIEYISTAQYSGAIELVWTLADKTLEMIPITDIFDACGICLSAHIAKTRNHFCPFYIAFSSAK